MNLLVIPVKIMLMVRLAMVIGGGGGYVRLEPFFTKCKIRMIKILTCISLFEETLDSP